MTKRITVDRIAAARSQIDPVFLNSPQYNCEPLSEALGCTVTIKCETQNPIRSFKGRGAETFMAARLAAGDTGPIVCASAGNFGQAIAYAGRRRGIPIIVYAAEAANPLKIARMRALGAEVRLHGADFDAAKEEAARWAAETGTLMAVDSLDVETAEGAGTIGLELLEADPRPDTVLIPLGNGAMINGIATAIKAHAPDIRIVAVQAAAAPAMVESWRSGTLVTTDSADTIADGIGVRLPVPEALDDMADLIDDAVLVAEATMIDAMRLVHEHAGLVVEPSGVVGLSAIMDHPDLVRGQHVATVLCGGNLTPEQIRTWLAL